MGDPAASLSHLTLWAGREPRSTPQSAASSAHTGHLPDTGAHAIYAHSNPSPQAKTSHLVRGGRSYGDTAVSGFGTTVMGDVHTHNHYTWVRGSNSPTTGDTAIHIPQSRTDEGAHVSDPVAPVPITQPQQGTTTTMHRDRTPTDDRRGSSQSSGVETRNTSRSESTSDASGNQRRGSRQEWQKLFEFTAHTAKFRLTDAGPQGNEIKSFAARCQVILEAHSNSAIHRKQQRLRIRDLQSEQEKQWMFWVPVVEAEISRTGSIIIVRFSNCVQKRNSRKNAINNYSAIYDRSKPNVELRIECVSEGDADHLEVCLLLLDERAKTENPEAEFYPTPSCVVWCNRSEKVSLYKRSSLFLWINTGTGERTCTMLDFGCFSSQLDFEIKKCEASTYLYLRYMEKLHFVPIDVGNHASWPPTKIKNNEDGGPQCTELGGSGDDVLSIPTTMENLLGLLNATIGTTTSWKVEDYWQVNVASFKTKNWIPFKSNPSLESGFLTLWTNEGTIRCLVRYDEQSDRSQWLSWTFRPIAAQQHPITTTPTLKVDGCDLTFNDLGPRSGPCLSLDPDSILLPFPDSQRRRSSLANTDEATKVKIRFSTEDAGKNFLSYIEGTYTLTA